MVDGVIDDWQRRPQTSSTRFVSDSPRRREMYLCANFSVQNIVWTFTLFWFSIYTNFDGSYLFDFSYIVLVNLAFTSLPVIFMGIFDQDVDDKISLAVPQLFMRGIEQKEWSELKFWYVIDTV